MNKQTIKEALHEVLDERPCSAFSKEEIEDIRSVGRVSKKVRSIFANSLAVFIVVGIVGVLISVVYFGGMKSVLTG